jgi:hypothetical protein
LNTPLRDNGAIPDFALRTPSTLLSPFHTTRTLLHYSHLFTLLALFYTTRTLLHYLHLSILLALFYTTRTLPHYSHLSTLRVVHSALHHCLTRATLLQFFATLLLLAAYAPTALYTWPTASQLPHYISDQVGSASRVTVEIAQCSFTLHSFIAPYHLQRTCGRLLLHDSHP